MTSQVEGPPSDLSRARRALRAEQLRIARWRRIVQARLELEVATIAAPDPIGLGPELLDLTDVPLHAPAQGDLAGALPANDPGAAVRSLPELRDLDRRLAAYEDRIETAMADLTRAPVRHPIVGESA